MVVFPWLAAPVGDRRMRRPDGTPYEALMVADVDLDDGAVTAHVPMTRPHTAPEGVYALVWLHGEPIGEVTMEGRAEDLLRSLPTVARSRLSAPLSQHLLRDALAQPGGWDRAVVGGLHAVEHRVAAASATAEPDGADVTVAVCTRDRPEDLRACLGAIAALRTRVSEILVVDNASSGDHTRHVAEEFDFVRYVREPRVGLNWARNRALLEARTRVVAFTDDDALVHPGWVDGIVRALREEPKAVVVTGLVVPAELSTSAQVLFEATGGFGRGFRRLYFAAAVHDGEVAARRFAKTGLAGTGANMAVLRAEVLALGGFDPALDVGTPTGGGGDLEMFFRVMAAGYLLVYEPSAVVRHRHRRTIQELVRQRRGDGTGSYSWILGAGRRYGIVQYAALLRYAIRWALGHHVRSYVVALLWRDTRRAAMRWAESRGALAAIVLRYYQRSRRRVSEEASQHEDEPTAPPLVHSKAKLARRRRPPSVLDVDVVLTPWEGPPLLDRGDHRRTVVRLRRAGELVVTFAVHTHGAGLSAARLRWEVASRLAPSDLGAHLPTTDQADSDTRVDTGRPHRGGEPEPAHSDASLQSGWRPRRTRLRSTDHARRHCKWSSRLAHLWRSRVTTLDRRVTELVAT